MERKRKNQTKSPGQPDAEVLKSARVLPQTMRSRLQLNLKPATIEKSLVYCLNDLGCKRGEQLIDTTEYHLMLLEICNALTQGMIIRQPKCGLLFSGQFGTGKTTLMLGFRKFFDLLKKRQRHGHIRKLIRSKMFMSGRKTSAIPLYPTRSSLRRLPHRYCSLTISV